MVHMNAFGKMEIENMSPTTQLSLRSSHHGVQATPGHALQTQVTGDPVRVDTADLGEAAQVLQIATRLFTGDPVVTDHAEQKQLKYRK